MDMSLEQPSPFKRFLRTWRREIIRGGVLFGIVVGAGLVIRSAVRNVKDHIPESLGTLGSFGNFDWGDGEGGNLFDHGRNVGDPWDLNVSLQDGQHVWIRNTNGPIEVVGGTSDQLQVHAEKSWRHSSPSSVHLTKVMSAQGITICAMWEAREQRCEDGGDYRMNGVRKNDVAVRFTVALPRGVRLDVSTVNGGLQIDGVSAPVEANTVNGRIVVNTSKGPIQATTVNGSIEANMQELTGGDVNLITVNGSVNAGLPRAINANVDAETVNGRVNTDFSVQVTGKLSPKHLRGKIGTGGPTLKLNTVNGSISLHEAEANPTPHPDVRVQIGPRVKVQMPQTPQPPHQP
jgi:putative adhesin